jgi:aminoglycoside 3-N-acetyltransferase I
MADSPASIRLLDADDVALMESLLTVFGDAFGEPETYGNKRPSANYLARLLANDTFLVLVALVDGKVAGGLAAYELRKFEQERTEIYIYDLAVAEAHRRRGIATAMIRELQRIGARRGAYVIFVQADHGDDAAIALYSKLGTGEDVLHFDIATET